MTREQEYEREKKYDGKEMEFGVVAEAGRIPAVEGFGDGHEHGGSEQKEGSELEQPPHESIVAP